MTPPPETGPRGRKLLTASGGVSGGGVNPVLDAAEIRRLVREALREDLGRGGDITSKAVVPASVRAIGKIISRQSCICAGLPFVQEIYRQLGRGARVRFRVRDGQRVRKGQTLAEVRGSARVLLAGERVSLNFLGRLSGIATLTRRFVDAARGSGSSILDTRKTTPLMRRAEKYAVTVGGGRNHRMGLYDGFMIKDNHIRVAGGAAEAVRCARKQIRGHGPLITEAENLRQVREACEAGTSIVLLDNFGGAQLRGAIRWIRANHPNVKTEMSGGVDLAGVRRIAALRIDRISVGALTHSAPAADLHMTIDILPVRAR